MQQVIFFGRRVLSNLFLFCAFNDMIKVNFKIDRRRWNERTSGKNTGGGDLY